MRICQRCGAARANIMLSEEEKDEHLCNDCYNQAVSAEMGLKIPKLPYYIAVPDNEGTNRMFAVEKLIVPNGIAIEAVESKENGYKFSVLGTFDCDQLALFKELYKKIETGIAKTYLTEMKWEGKTFLQMNRDELVGRIESRKNDNKPLIIVDGETYTWEEIGTMLMSNEGFQFQLKIADMTDDFEEEGNQ